MADENRMITFEYAAANLDAYKKTTIPSTKECMTKADIYNYINVDTSLLSPYTDNQLIKRFKVVGQLPFTVESIRIEYIKIGVSSFLLGVPIQYSGGTGKIYPPNTTILPMTSAGGVANYSVTTSSVSSNTQVVSGSGTLWVELYVIAWSTNDSFLAHIPIQADESGTPIAISTHLIMRRN